MPNNRLFSEKEVTQNLIYSGKAAAFKVLDRGNGRIALPSVSTGGFVTVKGFGGMAQVMVQKDEGRETSQF